jgi:hypothetical protein
MIHKQCCKYWEDWHKFSIYGKILKALHYISMQALFERSTNSASMWICNNRLPVATCHHFHKRCSYGRVPSACAFFQYLMLQLDCKQSGSLLFTWKHRNIKILHVKFTCRRNHFTLSYLHTRNCNLTTACLHNQLLRKIWEKSQLRNIKLKKLYINMEL